MDNDGWNDIYVCNGINRDVTNLDFMNFFADETYHKMVLSGKKKEINQLLKQIPRTPLPNKVFRNDGDLAAGQAGLKFTDIGQDWGFIQPSFSNGAAYGDLDNDGDLDLIVNNENQPAFVYKNNSRELNHNNYIGIVLKGKGKNTFAIGSKVKLFADGQIFTRELVPSRGFQSSVDYKMIIGLGKISHIDSLIVTWPDRSFTKFDNPAINQTHHIQQPDETKKMPDVIEKKQSTFFTQVNSNFDKHQENDVIDFYNERNIPRMLSREGPNAAVGDVNGDGLQDVFIGGTPGHAGQLYLQTQDGKFEKKEEKAFQQFSDFEDVAVLLFDYDHDGDLDLLICPGGNNALPNSREFQLRLFKNDGKGNFSIDTDAFPNTGMNVSVAIANDFNNDGFPDLFVGARSFPEIYGIDPASFLFVNDGKGHFTDIAKTKNPDIANIGMVCGAAWADVTGDAQKELIIVGEWMPPRIFSFNKDHFEEVKTNLNNLYGWWQTVAVADVNNDGKQDLLLGNIGENFYLQPDSTRPVKLWINDFDQNKSIEKIMTYTVDGKDMPVFLKKDLEDQLPSIKKNNLKNEAYSRKSIQELFPKELMDKCVMKKFNYRSSCVAINNGNGNFTIHKLPAMAQLSCINHFYPGDINNDGSPDLVLGGNQFGFLPQFERLDANFGDVLINNGRGEFTVQDDSKTGVKLRGQVRDIAAIKTNKGNYLLFLQNNEYPVLCEVNKNYK
ncbi:MAG: FG-GAP-like repeat-containing protein, partial [Chitinophagales bacterium]